MIHCDAPAAAANVRACRGRRPFLRGPIRHVFTVAARVSDRLAGGNVINVCTCGGAPGGLTR
jgi:hypothetical protein